MSVSLRGEHSKPGCRGLIVRVAVLSAVVLAIAVSKR